MMPFGKLLAGAAGALDTQTVTNGSSLAYGSGPYYNWYGYRSASFGSLVDGTSNLYGGASVLGLYFMEEYSPDWMGTPIYSYRVHRFEVNGTVLNSGWSRIKIGSTYYNRASALFSTDGSKTTWEWQSTITNIYISGAGGDFAGASTVVTWE